MISWTEKFSWPLWYCFPFFLYPIASLLTCGLAYAGEELVLQGQTNATRETIYYIWDTGDGRLIPSARGRPGKLATLPVLYSMAGEYATQCRAVTRSGRVLPAGESKISVTPEQESSGAKPLVFSSVLGRLGEQTVSKPLGGFVFQPTSPYEAGWVAVRFPGFRSLSRLAFDSPDGLWPADFEVQFSEDGGRSWRATPSAVFSHFPEPGSGQRIEIPLRGVVANALRLYVPRGNGADSRGAWAIDRLAVYGEVDPAWSGKGAPTEELAAWNNMWLNFGVAANEVHDQFDPWWPSERPLDGGMVGIGSSEWFYWNALKLAWLGDSPLVDTLESYLARNPVEESGYVWASPGGPNHLAHSRHYTTNAMYVMAVAHLYLMQRDPALLYRPDAKTGESILAKVRRAMDYQLTELGGQDGLLQLPGQDYDGTEDSLGSNYWDFWKFGYECAYTNALFYESLRLMAELESSLGNRERAEQLEELRTRVKQRYNETFWDEDKGRYVGWIDIDGQPYDFGFSFVNLQALACDLADAKQAQSILSWLDGERVIDGDDARDIYAFGMAPRSTSVEARRQPGIVITWGGQLDISPDGNAAFGKQIQNGGAIFYTSYYDLHARRLARGNQGVEERWQGIFDEYRKDQLRRDPGNFRGHSDVVGILREFPESGLVPYFFIDGIIGMRPVAEGWLFEPVLPPGWSTAEAKQVILGGQAYQVSVERGRDTPALEGAHLLLPASKSVLLTSDGALREIKEVQP